MIKINFPNNNKSNFQDKILQSNHKDNILKKPFVQRVTLKLMTNQSDIQTSRSQNNNQKSKPNLFEQQGKTPKGKQLFKTNNIKTFVRFRPLSLMQSEISQKHIQNLNFLPNNHSVAINDTIYSFDKVFRPEQNQNKVFQEVAKDMILKVLDGYNGTLFAYGQTGSGKTFTMFGDHRKGIIPLSIKQLFKNINIQQAKINCSLLEIYKETLIDLLQPQKNDLKIKQTSQGIQVMNLTVQQVKTEDQLLQVINKGNQIKKIRETSINQYSSRSHFILMLSIQQKGQDRQIIRSKLNLIDLAGSQKVNKSKAIGEGLEQAKKINLSLSCLSNTINALAKGNEHIPFRQSKLTRLLQQSLIGNCITSLIVTCSSHISCVQQTLSSLKFANRIKNIKTSVSKNIMKDVEPGIKKSLYDSLRSQYQNCEQKLQKVKVVIQHAKKTSHTSDKILNEISYIVENTKTLDSCEKKNKKTQSDEQLRKNSQSVKIYKELQQKYDECRRQIQNYRSIVVQQQLIIQKQQQKLNQQENKLKKYESNNRINMNLEEVQRKTLQLLEKQKDSYHIFQNQVLQKQINSLMNKLYPDNNQQKLQASLPIITNNFRNQYISLLETSLINYIKLFRKQIEEQEKVDYNLTKFNQQLNLQNQLLPLTYQKAIQQIKKKNELLVKLIKQSKHSLINEKLILQSQNKKLKQKVLIIENQLKLSNQKNIFYESCGMLKPNQILKPIIINNFQF